MNKYQCEPKVWLLIVTIGIIFFCGCTPSTSNPAAITRASGIIKKSGTANAPIVNVFATPNYSLEVIAKIDNGIVVDVTGKNSDSKFVLISMRGEKGWVSIYDIVSDQDLSLLPVATYTGSTWTSLTINNAVGIIKKCGTANDPIVNVYATPFHSLDVIAKINNGVVVNITGINSNSKFVLISLDGEKGWISDCDIVTEDDLFFLPVVSYTGSAWDSYVSSDYSFDSSSNTGKSKSSTGCPDGCTHQKEGCEIKGNISYDTGEKIYHLPWQEFYSETVINSDYGERWFCTEEEARQNGWRKSNQ